MENTNTVKFENDQAEWFIANGDQYQGPFKASEVYDKLMKKEASWIDHCFREKDGNWIRICDHEVFKSLQPSAPAPKPKLAPPPAPSVNDNFQWFLFQNESQTGPYPTSELKRLINAGQILAQSYVWRDGYSNWMPVGEVDELKIVAPGTPTPPKAPSIVAPKKVERRSEPRRPLVAQVYLTDNSKLITGLCRDISVGGMQMLTDQIPGEVGTLIRLNVNPPAESGLNAFTAEGVIVRILEDRRGFAFRFTNISEDAKKSIESYIA